MGPFRSVSFKATLVVEPGTSATNWAYIEAYVPEDGTETKNGVYDGRDRDFATVTVNLPSPSEEVVDPPANNDPSPDNNDDMTTTVTTTPAPPPAVTIPEVETPLTNLTIPEVEDFDIDDEVVPLGNLPKTGVSGISGMYGMSGFGLMSVAGIAGLIGLIATGKKKEEQE